MFCLRDVGLDSNKCVLASKSNNIFSEFNQGDENTCAGLTIGLTIYLCTTALAWSLFRHCDHGFCINAGITTVWADRGVSEEIMEEAFLTFAKNRESSTYFRSKPVTISRRNSTDPFVSLRPLINLRRRNSVENELQIPPPSSILGGAALHMAALANGLSHLHVKDDDDDDEHDGKSLRHQFNPNLPGLNGPIGGPPRSKTRRRYSIMWIVVIVRYMYITNMLYRTSIGSIFTP